MNEWLTLKMAGGDARPEPRNPVAGTLAALALVVLIGFLDYATGSEVILEILYLFPIVLSTLYFNRTAGLLARSAWRAPSAGAPPSGTPCLSRIVDLGGRASGPARRGPSGAGPR